MVLTLFLYIAIKSSNRLPQKIKQFPKIISDRLSKNVSNEEVFNESKREYENALKQSGYNKINLKYQPLVTSYAKQKLHRNIIWFNAPFSCNVPIDVKKVSTIHRKAFTTFEHKMINRNTITVSYCCLKNLGNIIKSLYKKLINSNN